MGCSVRVLLLSGYEFLKVEQESTVYLEIGLVVIIVVVNL